MRLSTGMPRAADAYLAACLLAAAVLIVSVLASCDLQLASVWPRLALLAVCGCLAQLFPVRTPRNQAYHLTVLFVVPAIFLLPLPLLLLLPLVHHVPEWLRERYPW